MVCECVCFHFKLKGETWGVPRFGGLSGHFSFLALWENGVNPGFPGLEGHVRVPQCGTAARSSEKQLAVHWAAIRRLIRDLVRDLRLLTGLRTTDYPVGKALHIAHCNCRVPSRAPASVIERCSPPGCVHNGSHECLHYAGRSMPATQRHMFGRGVRPGRCKAACRQNPKP